MPILDAFVYDSTKAVPVKERTELDHVIVSKLADFDRWSRRPPWTTTTPTRRHGRSWTYVDQLSIGMCDSARKRFWEGDMNADKQALLRDTLNECLLSLSQLNVLLFCAILFGLVFQNHDRNWWFDDWRQFTWLIGNADAALINKELGKKLALGPNDLFGLFHSLPKEGENEVRQPLQRIPDSCFWVPNSWHKIPHVEELIKSSKYQTIEYINDASGIFGWTV